jgi:hypothetical protein
MQFGYFTLSDNHYVDRTARLTGGIIGLRLAHGR